MIRWFIAVNRQASRAFDRLLPRKFSVDGNREFIERLVPSYLVTGANIADIGGGRHPYLTASAKSSLHARVTGVDISKDELLAAPAGAYDTLVVADIAKFQGAAEHDVIICQAVLEHVENVELAFKSLASMTRSGGRILIFVPCRNAAFARINLLLPESIKRHMLYFIFPETRDKQGFRSFYSSCTPKEFRRLAAAVQLEVELEQHFWSSTYFGFFFPLHVLWRMYQLIVVPVLGGHVSESFFMVLRKPCGSAHVVDLDVDSRVGRTHN